MTRSWCAVALLAFALPLAGGCSADHYFNIANKSLAKGQYDKAVENYNKALAKEPGNETYRGALDSARRQAADHFVDQARRHFAGADLAAAEADARTALRYQADDPAAAELLAQIRQRRAAATAFRDEALALASRGQFDEAIGRMNQALAADRSLPDGPRDLASLRRRAADRWLAAARAHMERGDLDAADRAARAATQYVPDDRAATALLGEIANRRQADQLVARARLAIGQRRYQAALVDLNEAAGLHPSRADLPGLIRSVKAALCDQHIAAGRAFLERDRLTDAMREFAAARDLLADYGDIDALIARTRQLIATRHRRQADRAFADSRWGAAVIEYLAADAAQPGSAPADRVARSAAAVRLRVTPRLLVLVGAHDARLAAPNAVEAIEPVVVEHLARVCPETVSVIGPDEGRRLLAARNLLPGDFFGPTADVARRRLEGVDVLVLVRALAINFSSTQVASTGIVEYESGVHRMPNPDYDAALSARNDLARDVQQRQRSLARLRQQEAALAAAPPSPDRDRQLRDVRSRIAREQRDLAAAQDALTRAEQVLAATPQHVDRPLLVQHAYPVVVHTRLAQMALSVQANRLGDGRVLADESASGLATASDKVVQGDPLHHVPPDPLTLPDDRVLARQAAMAAAVQAQALLERLCCRLGDDSNYLARAEAARQADRPDEAAEQYVNALFADPTANGRTLAALEKLAALIGYEHPPATLAKLLHERCDVLRPAVRVPMDVEARDDGLYVVRLPQGAAPPGLRLPCRLATFAGRPVRTIEGLLAALKRCRAGEAAPIELIDRDRLVQVMLRVEPAQGP